MKPTNIPLFALIAAAAAVSGWSEWSLFVSFAPAPGDLMAPVTVALGATGILFVLAQYTMAAETARRWQHDHRPLAVVCGIATAALMAISIAGTATWFDTAYKQATTPTNQPTAADLADQQLTAAANTQRLASAAALDKQAAAASAQNLLTKAAEYRAQAEAIRANIKTADRVPGAVPANQPPTQPATHTNQATIAGNLLGGWLFWAIALLVDAIPVLAAILLAMPVKPPRITAHNQLITTHNSATPVPDQTSQPEPEDKQEPAPEQPADALATLRQIIRTTGTMPTRSQAAALEIGQNAYRRACETLKQQGVIEQPAPGRPYRVLNRLEAVQ